MSSQVEKNKNAWKKEALTWLDDDNDKEAKDNMKGEMAEPEREKESPPCKARGVRKISFKGDDVAGSKRRAPEESLAETPEKLPRTERVVQGSCPPETPDEPVLHLPPPPVGIMPPNQGASANAPGSFGISQIGPKIYSKRSKPRTGP